MKRLRAAEIDFEVEGETANRRLRREIAKSAQRQKYGSRRETIDGINFQSRAEAERYRDLKLLAAAGEIRKLQVQPRFALIGFSIAVAGGETCGHYVADFGYEKRVRGDWTPVVEDVKSPPTAAKETYRFKRRLFRINYGFDITEVRPGRRRR